MKAGANFHSRKDNGVNGVNEITLRTKQENGQIVKI